MISDIYAINATNFDSHPFNLYRLKDINVTAMTMRNIPAKDTHIFIIELNYLTSNLKTSLLPYVL